MYMLARSRVKDYAAWKVVFDSHAQLHRDAGLTFMDLWRCVDEPNNVFFMFEVADKDRAEAFCNSPESVQAGEDAGVIDGEYLYLEDAPGY
jgi:hypothetical protein